MRRLLSAQFLWLATRLAGAGAGLVFQILLARILAPADLGLFFSATSLAALLGIVATQGYPSIAARFVSRYTERGRDRWLTQFLSSARRQIVSLSVSVAAFVMLAAWLWPDVAGDARLAFVYAGLCVPAMSALTGLAALGVAQRNFVAGLLPDLLIRPALLAAFAAGAFLFQLRLSASEAVLAFVGITLGIAAVQSRFVRSPPSLPRSAVRLSRRWRKEAWTLLTVMLFSSFFADLAIVGATPFLTPADLAAFGLSIKIAMIVGFGVQIAHQLLLPDLSDAYARRRLGDATPVLLKGAAFPIAFAAVAVLLTAVFGPAVLALYGRQFVYAAGPLRLLVSCQLLRALGGPSQNVLTLAGRQTTNLVICIVAGLVLLAGNAVLAPAFGLWGAAMAATASYGFWVIASCAALHATGAVRTDIVSVAIKALQTRAS